MRRVSQLCLLASQLCLLALIAFVYGEQNYNDDANAAANGDAADKYYYANLNQDKGYFSAGNEYIKYWTDYAILPKACIV